MTCSGGYLLSKLWTMKLRLSAIFFLFLALCRLFHLALKQLIYCTGNSSSG